MKWIKYELKTTTEATDLIVNMLSELGVNGVEVVDNVPLTNTEKEKMFVDILPESKPDDGNSILYFYISDGNETDSAFYNTGTEIENVSDIDPADLLNKIRSGLEEISQITDIGEGTISISKTEDEDWANNWKNFFHPFKIGENIIITPTWEKPEHSKNDLVIKIDPGAAFGTGTHETTKLCVEELIKYVKKDFEILDIGCGSAILTIAAIKLGAKSGYAIDIDSTAAEQAIENVEINEVSDKVVVETGNLLNDKELCRKLYKNPFDVIVANILVPVLVSLTPVIVLALKEGGYYIVSGIVKELKEDVITAIRNAGLHLVSENCENDWVCLVARK